MLDKDEEGDGLGDPFSYRPLGSSRSRSRITPSSPITSAKSPPSSSIGKKRPAADTGKSSATTGAQKSSSKRSRIFGDAAGRNFATPGGGAAEGEATPAAGPSGTCLTAGQNKGRPAGCHYCVMCQMPFELLHAWETEEVHVVNCLEMSTDDVPECPAATGCKSLIRSHYCKFGHKRLALMRNLSEAQDRVAVVGSSWSPFTTSSNSSPSKGGQPENSLDRGPLRVEARRDKEGDLRIRVKVDPIVELNRMVVKVPSSTPAWNMEPPSPTDSTSAIDRVRVRSIVTPKQQKPIASKAVQTTINAFFKNSNGNFSNEGLVVKPAAATSGNRARPGRIGPGTEGGANRSCPFYKKIPGTDFVVDAFCYGRIPGVSKYFLSHFHYDHFRGLNRKFDWGKIICSKVTANLIKLKIGIEPNGNRILALPLDEPIVVDGVEVTLLDANHCPGSVMFLFKLPFAAPSAGAPSTKVVLHCGDFRADPRMEEYPALWNLSVDKVFLDTTYCRPDYDFPPQANVIETTVELIRTHLKTRPGTIVLTGSYTIGKKWWARLQAYPYYKYSVLLIRQRKDLPGHC